MPRGLIYFADPMCSWCWGFSNVINKVKNEFSGRLPIRFIAGGLYVGADKPLDQDAKVAIREHWQHVAELSGAKFDYAFFDRPQFVYNTEPACRAIVVVQEHEPTVMLAFLKHLQEAFYTRNRDISDREIIFDEAEKFGFNRQVFTDQFDDEKMISETRNHFAITRQLEVTGFPTLFAVDGNGQHAITSGYQAEEKICSKITAWIDSSISRETDS